MNGYFREVSDLVNTKYYYKLDNTGLGCSISTYYMFWWNEASTDVDGILPNPAVGWYISWGIGFSPFSGMCIQISCIIYHSSMT